MCRKASTSDPTNELPWRRLDGSDGNPARQKTKKDVGTSSFSIKIFIGGGFVVVGFLMSRDNNNKEDRKRPINVGGCSVNEH